MIGANVYFKLAGMQRTRRGVVIGGNDSAGWQVEGRRSANKFHSEVFTVPAENMQPEAAFKASKAKSSIRDGRIISATEMNRRADVATERFHLTESQVFQARAMLEIRRRILRKLASTNGISSTASDFEFEELTSEYLIATITAYRSATSKAPVVYLDEFREHLQGKRDRSRIMASITRTGKTAAIRYLKARSQYHQFHDDITDHEWRLAA